MLGVNGIFQIKVRNPDMSIAHDTGIVKNTITKLGVEYMLEALVNFSYTEGTDPAWGGVAALTSGDYITYVHLGYLNPAASASDIYGADAIGDICDTTSDDYNPLGFLTADKKLWMAAAYNNAVPGSGETYNNSTHASRLQFTTSFPAAHFSQTLTVNINTISLISDNARLLAASTFSEFTVNPAQIVDIAYSIYLTQP